MGARNVLNMAGMAARGQERILRCDLLPARTKKDGPFGIAQCAPLAYSKSINRSFIDQACLVQMGRYWPLSIFFFNYLAVYKRRVFPS